MSDTIKNGDIIGVEYKGTLDNGEVFDAADKESPLYFKVGDGEVMPKFENDVLGLKVGDSKKLTLLPEDAYGPFDENKKLNVKKSDFPNVDEVFPGMPFYYTDPEGQTAYAYIDSVDGENVIIDFNHPLAGKTLHFDYTILSINAIDEEQLNKIYEDMYNPNAGGCGSCGGCSSCDDDQSCGCSGCGCN